MKKLNINLIVFLLFSILGLQEGAISQTGFVFNYEITINGSTTSFAGVSSGGGGVYVNGQFWDTTPNTLPSLCPGDVLTIKNLCKHNGNDHDFNGMGTGNQNTNPYGKATIGLTNRLGCTDYGQSTISANTVTHLGDVCDGVSGCLDTTVFQTPMWDDWDYGTSKTVTIPSFNSLTGEKYLLISARLLTFDTPQCHQTVPYCFTEIDGIGETPEEITDQTICPNASVDLNLNSSYNYSTWNPTNPEINPPTVTTNYTVDVVTGGSCSGTITDAFTITVNEPVNGFINQNTICGIFIFNPLNFENTQNPINSVTVNGIIKFEHPASNNVVITQPGTYSIVIEYLKYGYDGPLDFCTKEYTIIIGRKPFANLGNDHYLCTNDAFPILDPVMGPGLSNTYDWTFSPVNNTGVMNVGNSPTLQTTNYGTYTVTVTSSLGCSKTTSVDVLLSPSAAQNINANFDYTPSYSNGTLDLNTTPHVLTGFHTWKLYSSTNGNPGSWGFPINTQTTQTMLVNNLSASLYYRVEHEFSQKPCKEVKIVSYNFDGESTKKIIFRRKSIDNTSESESSSNIDFSLYPNPANESVSINSNIENYSYRLLDVTGKMIQSGTDINGVTSLNIVELENGIYIVEISNPIDGSSTLKKLIKN